jgi:hypothetical protein
MACGCGPPRVPRFNLLANIWYNGALFPTLALPDLVVPCQLVQGERVTATTLTANVFLLVPARTNIHWARGFTGNDGVECPAGSGMFYRVYFVCDVGRGFTNEYREAFLQVQAPIPVPLP